MLKQYDFCEDKSTMMLSAILAYKGESEGNKKK